MARSLPCELPPSSTPAAAVTVDTITAEQIAAIERVTTRTFDGKLWSVIARATRDGGSPYARLQNRRRCVDIFNFYIAKGK